MQASRIPEKSKLINNVHIGLPFSGCQPDECDNLIFIKGNYSYWHYGCDGLDDRGWGCGYRTLQTICSWIKHQQAKRCFPYALYNTPNIIKSSDGHSSSNNDCSDHNISPDIVTDALSCNSYITNTCRDSASYLEDFEKNDICVIGSGDGSSADDNMSAISIAGTAKSKVDDTDSYITKDDQCQVPSIPEIQTALVKMGDKPSTFVGSHQWIGSYEICLCIDYFYNVPCKILHIPHGSDLSGHMQTLHQHFQMFASPIMMGGDSDNSSKGILGVCTSPAALLVLDPHYYGDATDCSYLQNHGWVKWVSIEDFHKTSFYNLCMPQLAAL